MTPFKHVPGKVRATPGHNQVMSQQEQAKGTPAAEEQELNRVTVSCIEKGRFTRGVGALCIFTALVIVLVLADMLVGRKTYVTTKGTYATTMRVL